MRKDRKRIKKMLADFNVEVNIHVVDLSNRSEISKLWKGGKA